MSSTRNRLNRLIPTLLGCILVLIPAHAVSAAPAKLAPVLVLPYYVVDAADAGGVTTFFAVRNRTEEAVDVRYSYHPTDAGQLHPEVVETLTLAPHETRSVNVRSVAGLSAEGGLITGYMVAKVVDSLTGMPVADSTALAGDFLRVDYGNAFASGGPLLNFDFCRSWDLRFYHGGGFDGGTDIAFYAPYNPDGEEPVVTGKVYDEAGTYQGDIGIPSSDYAFEVNTSELDLPVPFGTVEWTFADGVAGHVAGIYSALGTFSVGTPAICADAAEALTSAVVEGVSAKATASTAAMFTEAYTTVAALLTRSDSPTWNATTESWNVTADLVLDYHTELSLQFRDAEGDVQQYPDLTTRTLLAAGEIRAGAATLAVDLLIDLDLASETINAVGRGTATGTGTRTMFLVEELALAKPPGPYPQSGKISVILGEVTVEAEFNDTQYAEGSYTAFGGTTKFTIDLDDGSIVEP